MKRPNCISCVVVVALFAFWLVTPSHEKVTESDANTELPRLYFIWVYFVMISAYTTRMKMWQTLILCNILQNLVSILQKIFTLALLITLFLEKTNPLSHGIEYHNTKWECPFGSRDYYNVHHWYLQFSKTKIWRSFVRFQLFNCCLNAIFGDFFLLLM